MQSCSLSLLHVAAAAALPHGLPNPGLPVASLRGLASRDGMARALARQLTPAGDGAQD